MFKETPRYMGFPNQIWVQSKLAFRNFEMMFKGKAPFFVSHYRFKDPETPIVDNLFFDIDSYYSIRFPYRNSKVLRHWAYKHDIPHFTNFSVTGDREMLVKINDEIKMKTIKNVIDDFKEGKLIETLSYHNGKVVFSPIYNYLEHEEDIYKIYHEQSTLPLKLTKHHSIYKWDNSDIIKVKKNEIKQGDFIVTFNRVDIKSKDNITIKQSYTYRNKEKTEDIVITDSLLRLMGYYVAEGHTRESMVAFSFNINEHKYHQEVKEAIANLEPAKLSRKSEINIREVSPHDSVNDIQFCSKKYKPFFVEQCGSTQEYRHVPSFLFSMSKEKFLIFLTAYLNGDGSYRKKHSVTAKTISRRLAIELTWLCKIHGISCSIRVNDYRDKRKEFNTKIVYVIDINKKDLYEREKNNKYHPDTREKLLPTNALKKVYYQCKPKRFKSHRLEQMTLRKERASYQRIKNVIKWFDETKSCGYSNDSKKIISNYERIMSNNAVGFLKVKKVTENTKEKHKVYDVSVIDAENFFCGPYPILHKNSGGKGYHNFLFFKPIIPKNEKEYNELKDIIYSLQMKIAEEIGMEAFDEPTFGRLRFLVRYPTSKYVRKDEDTGAFTSNGMYCRYLTDKEFDLGVKRLSKVVTDPGVVPRKPRTKITLDDIIDCFDDFKIIKRADKNKGLNLDLRRNGNILPNIQALGLPCLQEIVSHPHPTHYERIELVAWLKHLGYTDLAINAFIRKMNWTRYKYSVTSYQIRTVKPRMVKCTFLRKSYKHLCKYCPFGRR